jgi:hypothetical protein
MFGPNEMREHPGECRCALCELPTTFHVGERVGLTEGPEAVQIEILSVEPPLGRITAKVVVLGHFYSARRLTGAHGTSMGYVFGEVLSFHFDPGGDAWICDNPRRPWHILSSAGGRKTFEHYR